MAVALTALYAFRLRDRWRLAAGGWSKSPPSCPGSTSDVFVMIVQSFQKVSFLKPLAPTGSEPPFILAQAVTLGGFALLGWVAAIAFQPRLRIVS